jgi:exonuclease III
MLYNIKYKGGVLLLINKNIRKEFIEINMIPDDRSITIMTNTINEKYNLYLHFIYEPAKTNEANIFWQTTNEILKKKQSHKDKHTIIGDLNIQMEVQDSNSGKKTKLPKGLKEIIKRNNLIDAYKYKNKNKQNFTYFSIQENNEIKSKLNYTLMPIGLENTWHSLKIHKINKKISTDHKPIEITLR